ncbi:MAG TPA: EamA/RhaT family transporter [Desulfobulbaceae bacterium]|nr:EamA/RhaT family transporter [Desulfobulbaceae bacterium]
MSRSAGTTAAPPLWALHLLMLLAAILVSTSFTVGKAITAGLDPIILTLVRFILAALLFLPYIRRRFGLAWPGWPALGRYSVISGALIMFFWLMFESLRSTTAFNTSVIFTLVPGISGMYSAAVLRERLGRYRLLALALAMAGALWVIFQGDIGKLLALELGRGDVIFFIGCLFMAAYTPLVKLLHRGESMAVMTFWVLVTGSLWLVPAGLDRLPAVRWQEVAPMIWWGILYLAIFCTIVTFFLTQFATLRLGPTRVMAYSYLYPPLVVAIDWLLGHGLPPLQSLLGVPVIVLAMVVVQRGAESLLGTSIKS